MAVEPPKPGDVVPYWYLWHHEANRGQEEGVKPRPCLVVRRLTNEQHQTKLFIVPITTRPPSEQTPAIEVPAQTQNRLGLEGKRSWIITNEVNSFTWIGPDMDRTRSGTYTYGAMPAGLVRAVQRNIIALNQHQQVKVTLRDEVKDIARQMKDLSQDN